MSVQNTQQRAHVKFKDLLLVGGNIHTHRDIDTETMAPDIFDEYVQLLGYLRGGDTIVEADAGGFVLTVQLGLPSLYDQLGDRVESPGRFFSIGEPGAMPFFVTLLLNADLHPRVNRDCATILAISEAMPGSAPNAPLPNRAGLLQSLRPCAVHAMLPGQVSDQMIVPVIEDFSAHFAAAMFLAN